jgi:hypothetical protein
MSHVISMHRPGDPRQTGVCDLSRLILCLVVSKFEHSTLVVRAKQHNHSTIAVLIKPEISLATAFFSKLLKNCMTLYLILMYSNVTPKNRMNLIG